jgi:hypothetical protein
MSRKAEAAHRARKKLPMASMLCGPLAGFPK